MALHPAARSVLVVGLGGGATPGAVSAHDGVEVDVVELSESVVRAAPFFSHVNFDVVNRPNVHVRVDDGRNYLLLTPRKYDVVTADIILPIHAGSNNIYSREYFTLVRNALKPDGLAMQWVFGTDAEHKTITRTFLSVFPYATLWGDGTVLIGSLQPFRLRRGDFEWKRQLPGRRQALEDLGAGTWEKLLAMYIAGPDELRRYVGDGPILTDDLPLVEYFLSLPRDKTMDLRGVRSKVEDIVVP
jgi:spermidine synthase